MLYPRKRAWFSRWFAWVIERRLRATFDGVVVRGLGQLDTERPWLLVVNHSSWWDAMMIVWLSERVLQRPGYAWMHRHNLSRLPFFRLLGAFGVDNTRSADVKAALAYVRRRLQGQPCALWIFPQGDEKPAEQRPLGFTGGSAWMARRSPEAMVIPVALHYGFGAREKPQVQVCFGAPLPTTKATPEMHEHAVTQLLDACARADTHLDALSPGCRVFAAARNRNAAEPWAVRMLSGMCRWYLALGDASGFQPLAAGKHSASSTSSPRQVR